jgi:hypothetical protein
MKSVAKLIGVITLAAVIGFSVAGCDNGDTDDNNTNMTLPTWPAGFIGDWENISNQDISLSFQYPSELSGVIGNTIISGHGRQLEAISGDTYTTIFGNSFKAVLNGNWLIISESTGEFPVNGTYSK